MLQYKTQADKIIQLFKERMNELNTRGYNFSLIDYTADSISVRSNLHIISINLKQEDEIVNVIINFTFEGKDAMAQNFASVGGDRLTTKIVTFINSSLDSSEVTENARQYLIEKQSSTKKGTTNVIIMGIVLFFMFLGVMMFIFSF